MDEALKEIAAAVGLVECADCGEWVPETVHAASGLVCLGCGEKRAAEIAEQ